MIKAVYPGEFDPITNGHLNIIERANKLVDQLIIAICINNNINTYFSPKERRDMIVENISEEIEVEYYEGLLIDFMQKVNFNLIVKELRSLSDFELEFQKALMNKKLDENIETILLTSEPQYNYLSSDLVREISESKAKVKEFVPENVQDKLKLN